MDSNNIMQKKQVPMQSTRKSLRMRQQINLDTREYNFDIILGKFDLEMMHRLQELCEQIPHLDAEVELQRQKTLRRVRHFQKTRRQSMSPMSLEQAQQIRNAVQSEAEQKMPELKVEVDESLTMAQFVRVMLKILVDGRRTDIERGSDEYFNLILSLCQMFEEIDVNCDGGLDWSEVLQFLMSKVELSEVATLDLEALNRTRIRPIDNLAVTYAKGPDNDFRELSEYNSKVSGDSDLSSYLSHFSEVEEVKEEFKKRVVEDTFQGYKKSKFEKYGESESVFDKTSHRSAILKAIYSERHERFFVVHSEQKLLPGFQIVRAATEISEIDKRSEVQRLYVEQSCIPPYNKPAMILDMCLNQKSQMLGLVCSDGRIFFYQSKADAFEFILVFVIDASSAHTGGMGVRQPALPLQTRIWACTAHDVFLTTGKDNILREWDIGKGFGDTGRWSNAQMQWRNKKAQQLDKNGKAISLRKGAVGSIQGVFEFYYSPFLSYCYERNEDNDIVHHDLILDVQEILSPMLIATASVDKLIRLISIKERRIIGVFAGHKKGVRQLDCTPYQEGYMVSCGYESEAIVWSLEGGLGAIQSGATRSRKTTRATQLHGRLMKGKQLVRAAKFMPSSPFCVTIDDKCIPRLWNYIRLELHQALSPLGGDPSEISDILVFKNLKRFAVVGRRLHFFDTYRAQQATRLDSARKKTQKTSKPTKQRPLQPLGVAFNRNVCNFVVVMPNELRIYCGATGRLLQVYSDVIDTRSGAEITSFVVDSNATRLFTGDAAGTVRSLNISNGCKILTLSNRDDAEFNRIRAEHVQSGRNRDIIGMHVVHGFDREGSVDSSRDGLGDDSRILLVNSWDNTTRVFDEKQGIDDPADKRDDFNQVSYDARVVVRSWQGACLDDQIVISAVSKHHSLMATGNLIGQINVWDFETGKVERAIFAGMRRITMMAFLDKYPILVSGTSGGQVQVWSMSRAPLAYRYSCLGRFMNGAPRLSTEGEMYQQGQSITCGDVAVLKIDLEHEFKGSDRVTVPAEEWSSECEVKEEEDYERDLDYFENMLATAQKNKNLSKEEDKKAKIMAQKARAAKFLQLIKQASAAQHEGYIHNRDFARENGSRGTYDRGLVVGGTVTGHIKIWDLTHCLKQKTLSVPKQTSTAGLIGSLTKGIKFKFKTASALTDDQQLDEQDIIQLESNPKAAYEERISYNPMRRMNIQLPVTTAKSLLSQAHEQDHYIQGDVSVDDIRKVKPCYAMIHGDALGLQTSNHNDVEDRVTAGLNLDRKFRNQRMVTLKAHGAAVTSIRVFDHGNARSFVTSGEDWLIKVYSLQKEELGPLDIECLGVIDLKKAYVPKATRFWRFPYETEQYNQRQEMNFKDVMRQILYHEWLEKHPKRWALFLSNLKGEKELDDFEAGLQAPVSQMQINVIDPRMDELTRDMDMVVKKAEQRRKEQTIISSKISNIDKRSIALKLRKRKEVKSLAQMKALDGFKEKELQSIMDHYPAIQLKDGLQALRPDVGTRLSTNQHYDHLYAKLPQTNLKLSQFDPHKTMVEFEVSQSHSTRALNKDRSYLNIQSHLANTMARDFSPDVIQAIKNKDERARMIKYLEGYSDIREGQVEFDDVTGVIFKKRKRNRRPVDSSDDEEDDNKNPTLADDVRGILEKRKRGGSSGPSYGDVRRNWVVNVRGLDGTSLGRAQDARSTALDETGALQLQNLGYDKEVQDKLRSTIVQAKNRLIKGHLPIVSGGSTIEETNQSLRVTRGQRSVSQKQLNPLRVPSSSFSRERANSQPKTAGILKLKKVHSEVSLPGQKSSFGGRKSSRKLTGAKSEQEIKRMPVDQMAAYKDFLKSAVDEVESVQRVTKFERNLKAGFARRVEVVQGINKIKGALLGAVKARYAASMQQAEERKKDVQRPITPKYPAATEKVDPLDPEARLPARQHKSRFLRQFEPKLKKQL